MKKGKTMQEQQIERIKGMYHPGVSVRLISMHGKPQMTPDMKGTVEFVDDAGQIHVTWENGSSLVLNCEVDKFVAFCGPTARDIISEWMFLMKSKKIWYRESENRLPITIDIGEMIQKAEEYMEGIVKKTQTLAATLCKPYNLELIWNNFIALHLLVNREKRKLDKKTDYTATQSEAGMCPKCGNELDLESGGLDENYYAYNWNCIKCGASGREFYDLSFAGHFVEFLPGKPIPT